MINQSNHKSVMTGQAIEQLHVQPGCWYVDCTLGGGGHTQALLQQGAKVVAYDWDAQAVALATARFTQELASGQLIIIHDSFVQIGTLKQIPALRHQLIRGILFDFGTSTDQLLDASRGFSFNGNGPLDMRMDTRRGVTASQLLQFLSERELAQLLWRAGEKDARKIAKALKKQPVTTSQDLSEVVKKVKRSYSGAIHPATKTFMALRIAVNTEIEEIKEVLPLALEVVANQGRLVTISFHDGEDATVKEQFSAWEKGGKGYQVSQKPLQPTDHEIDLNHRSRSAKLRVFVKEI